MPDSARLHFRIIRDYQKFTVDYRVVRPHYISLAKKGLACYVGVAFFDSQKITIIHIFINP